jgi:hypothetical protein
MIRLESVTKRYPHGRLAEDVTRVDPIGLRRRIGDGDRFPGTRTPDAVRRSLRRSEGDAGGADSSVLERSPTL